MKVQRVRVEFIQPLRLNGNQMSRPGHLDLHPGTDPRRFKTIISSVDEQWITLRETEFYPSGGGQPADFGTITCDNLQLNVQDVRTKQSVKHEIARLPEIELQNLVGAEAECQIDSEWRNRLCRMHTAQHLISALANEMWDATTVGNQIGPTKTRIDLKFKVRDEFNLDDLQSHLDAAVHSDLSVSMQEIPRQELLSNPLVRVNMALLPPHIDMLRTISIGDLDVCPCAGTHVASTQQIGVVELLRVRSKGAGKLRLEYQLSDPFEHQSLG